jgi:release factor glutamine methyltransferase
LDRKAAIDRKSEAFFQELLNRRSAREPLQYILEAMDFCNIKLGIDSSVLIPLSETELLVEWPVTYVKRHYSNDSKTIATLELHILDIWTGSVTIRIALANYFSKSRVVAIDHSPMALEMA